MLYKVVLPFESVDESSISVTILMTAVGQYFPLVLFTMLYKVVLPFESVDESSKRDYSNDDYTTEHYFSLLPFVMLYRVVLTFESLNKILKCDYADESF